MARIHPGEAPASFIVQGLMEFLAANSHPIAKILRENVVFKILPMMNPDGVFLGNNRCNVVGHDLNRSWDHMTSFLHPTLASTLKLLRELTSSEVGGLIRLFCGWQLKILNIFLVLSNRFCD